MHEATAGLLVISATLARPGVANLVAVLRADRRRGSRQDSALRASA